MFHRTRLTLAFVAAAGAAFALATPAFADDDPLQTARGIALDDAIKTFCASQFKVNAQEIDQTNLMIRSLVPKNRQAALDAGVTAQAAKLKADIDAAGVGPWCLDQKARILAVGGAKMFQ